MLKILQQFKELLPNQTFLNIEEFTGKVEPQLLPGKGRGLIAKQDFQPGDLILANRALAIIFPNVSTCSLDNTHSSSSLLNKVKRFRLLKEEVAKLVANDSNLRVQVYDLSAGPNLGHVNKSESLNVTAVDLDRIEGICTVNGFQAPKSDGLTEGSIGLWYTPSFINHDCFKTNALWNIYNDFIFIRAARTIREGEEILISYIDPHQPYFVRREMFLKHDFICECKLCKIEQTEGKLVRRKREILLNDFMEDVLKGEDDVENIEGYIEDLEELRRLEYQEFNPFTLQPLMHLGLIHFEKMDYKEASKAFQRAFKICSTLIQLLPGGVSLLESIIRCHLKLGEKDKVVNWTLKMKEVIGTLYGKEDVDEILRVLKPKFMNELELYGIQL